MAADGLRQDGNGNGEAGNDVGGGAGAQRARRRLRFVPRFRLRTLLLAILVIAVLIPTVQTAWRRYVIARDSREYAERQADEDAYVERELARNGTSSSVDRGRPIPDGFVVLVRQGNTFGCFIPDEQGQKGESLKYAWWYREDGSGRFDAGEPSVQPGEAFAGPYVSGGDLVRVEFGPFSIKWSGHETGWGFLYYEYVNNLAEGEEPVRICTTNRRSVRYLDARSGDWIYRAERGDEGVRGDEAIEAAGVDASWRRTGIAH